MAHVTTETDYYFDQHGVPWQISPIGDDLLPSLAPAKGQILPIRQGGQFDWRLPSKVGFLVANMWHPQPLGPQGPTPEGPTSA